MPKRNSSNVATALRNAIRDGTFQRFERLPPSRELAETYGVARNTLRGALIQLENEGLLETRAGSGSYVSGPAPERFPSAVEHASPLELIDTRFALEPHICCLCVLHGRREDFQKLEALCQRMENAADDPVAFAEADTDFHYTLARATRNALLVWLIEQIHGVRVLEEWTRMRHLTLNRETIATYNRQHRDVLQAIRDREPELAATHMKSHLESARLSLTRAVDT